jgi:hypothetical protein
VAVVLAAALAASLAASAQAGLPRTFFGTMVNGPLDDAAVYESEAAVMQASGVGSVRMPFDWGLMQGSREAGPDFSTMDARVSVAARHGLDVLALVLNSPGWAARDAGRDLSAPRDRSEYTRFLVALIGRYGPHGTFWPEHPGVPRHPIRAWQIWNEPNLSNYWSEQPYPKPYKRLLCAAYGAVHRADPGAKVVMAGLANYSWRAMAALERAGVHGCFDVAAVHPFSGRPSNSLKITRLNRAVLDHAGDRSKPIWLTELTWSSAKGATKNTHGWETTAAGQAARLREAYTLYARNAKALRLQRIFWYTWVTKDRDSPNSFEWSGLREARPDGTIADKPALRALRSIVKKYRTR